MSRIRGSQPVNCAVGRDLRCLGWHSCRMDVDVELDCRGLRCPLPVIRLANNIGDLSVGQTLALVADDPAARPDVTAWCRMREQEYVGEDTADDGTPRFVVRRLH